jgi:hypothetical protein
VCPSPPPSDLLDVGVLDVPIDDLIGLLTKVFGSRAVVLNQHIEFGLFYVTETYW